ncbi:hypothetical protein [Sideroxydans lithotrophicus]|uniref:Uncharacterized protein n=1 Tax=Sideroxydans lithotrophicus (strain ES-1) TaxID=580332 RepID=D5CLR0_SIDLE|nr:hypothetical protein [Sideroxydans lithotrophicus]ADE12505.1 hypothetical protein Slit_2277 [Sideroxydans lithotrophicus ES-1]
MKTDAMEKTVKIPAYKDEATIDTQQGNLADQSTASELAKKEALLEEEKSKSLDLLKTIVQLRESLKQEQVKTSEIVKKASELEAKAKEESLAQVKDLTRLAAQLEEEKKKTQEQIKLNEQLKVSLKQEQTNFAEVVKKTAALEAKLNRLDAVEENQLMKKNAQLEEEQKKSLEYMRTIEQLRETLKQDQARMTELMSKSAEQDSRAKELAALEAKVKDLSGALNKIASIAATGKMAGDV